MATQTQNSNRRRPGSWRVVMWCGAALLLLLPWVAMQFTAEVAWDLSDFIVFGAMLLGACGTCELAVRMNGSSAYHAAVGVAVAAAFLLVWINLAVGIIGNENNLANLMYGGVLAVAMIGALIARFRPQGMAFALAATALAQVLVSVIAAVAGWGYTFVFTAIFVALWLLSAQLFRRSAREEATTRALR